MGSNPLETSVQSDAAGEPTTRIAVDIRRFPWIRRLAADYAYNFSSVAPFFSGDPSDRAAWAHAIRCAQANARGRTEIAAILSDQQARRGAPPQARDAARLLADGRTVALVTGQQAGLFGGPLFTLLKALTALKLADKVSREHGVPAVAVFWIDAEDHDWNEVRTCTVFDDTLAPKSVALPPRQASADPSPVAAITLDDSVSTALDELAAILPPTEFREALLADLRAAYAPGTGMAAAFGRWLERVLGERGLIVFDCSDPAAKPLAAKVFARELTSPGETAKLANAAGAELVARGYHSQVHAADDAVALFHLDGGRRPIRRHDGGFAVGSDTYTSAALVELAGTTPSAFSPNVLLRPIVQDTLFPTVCYVAGPNELAYLAQLRQVYERFGAAMPLMYPRASATLADSSALRFLQKYQVAFEALQPQDESSLNVLLQSQIPSSVEESFAAATQALETAMGRLIQTIPVLDPTLQGAAQSTLGKMQHDLATLHNKMIQAAKRRDDTLRRQYTRTRALAFPLGHAQERTIGFVSFLNQYGPALVDRLERDLPLDPGHHWIVSI